ncbi:MFS transporter [Actinomadura rudentiformis]|uniref:MFS transporter n=1 Tax=Actinomadura rudentiformis TaxID=359158 RepID=A0A6H9Z5H5_9ACTN|nr:MFS transporter [Actinomadura rudentiformis]KAB2351369.1 MFS transporter [Actinomadura rudentiformis]
MGLARFRGPQFNRCVVEGIADTMTTTMVFRPPLESPNDPAWQRDYKLLWGGSAISMLGGMGATLTGPLVGLALSGSAVATGWIVAAGTLPHLLLQIPAGIVADRLDRRWTMLVSQIVRGMVAATAGALLFVDELSIPLLLLSVAISGICVTFHGVAEVGVVPMIVPRSRLPQAMATNEARNHLALLLGRPLSGLIYGLDRALPFAAESFSCLVSAVTIALIRTKRLRPTLLRPQKNAQDRAGRTGTARSLINEMGGGLRWLWEVRFLRTAMLVCVVTNFLFQAIILLLVVASKERGLSTLVIGVLLAAPGLGGLVGTLVAPASLKRVKPTTVVRACVWVWFGLTGAIALSSDPLVWFVAWAGVGFMGAHMNVTIATHQAMTAPPELLGRVTSANRFLSLGAVPLGTICAGYGISVMGPSYASLVVCAVIGALAVAITARRRSLPPLSLRALQPELASTDDHPDVPVDWNRVVPGEVIREPSGDEQIPIGHTFVPADRLRQNSHDLLPDRVLGRTVDGAPGRPAGAPSAPIPVPVVSGAGPDGNTCTLSKRSDERTAFSISSASPSGAANELACP